MVEVADGTRSSQNGATTSRPLIRLSGSCLLSKKADGPPDWQVTMPLVWTKQLLGTLPYTRTVPAAVISFRMLKTASSCPRSAVASATVTSTAGDAGLGDGDGLR